MTPKFLRAALFSLPLLLAACGDGGATDGAANGAAAKPEEKADSLVQPSDMVLGAEDAPVTVIEYASVTCPHCATFHETIFPGIKEDYVDTGKAKFVFREFPTPPQGLSYVGSVLARCAAEKGGSDAYFLVIGALFKNQKTWLLGDDPKLELTKIAAQAGMDEAAFDACMKRQDLVDLINRNVAEGSEKYSINATPSFVVDGERIPAVRSEEDLAAAIETALAGDAE